MDDRDRELEMLADDGLVTVTEAADFLSISRASLYLKMNRGEIQSCRLGKSRRIPKRALLNLIRDAMAEAK